MAGTPITIAHGDGLGPAIMEATVHILIEAAGRIDVEAIKVSGEVGRDRHRQDVMYSDLWNRRFLWQANGAGVDHVHTVALSRGIASAGFGVVKIEGLSTFHGQRGYSLGQGE